jgi:site-specific DNA-methyltransferase (adenine-specific)
MIPERAVLLSTKPGDLVLDPFGGGGSTFQAAEANERFWLGTELYDCIHIESRLRDKFPLSVGKSPIFEYWRMLRTHENLSYQVL